MQRKSSQRIEEFKMDLTEDHDPTKPSLTDALPDEILENISMYLNHKELKQIAQTSSRLHSFFQPVMNASQLLRHVINADYIEAEKLTKL